MKSKALKPALSGLFLALALLLPFLTAADPKIGNMFLPMHLPVMLCGFICGPVWGLAAGLFAPLLRSLLFSAPMLFPTAIAMSFELATYGAICGLIYNRLSKGIGSVYITLITAMLVGRAVWGIASALLYTLAGNSFGFELFLSGALFSAVPGIVIQLIIIPPIVVLITKYAKKK